MERRGAVQPNPFLAQLDGTPRKRVVLKPRKLEMDRASALTPCLPAASVNVQVETGYPEKLSDIGNYPENLVGVSPVVKQPGLILPGLLSSGDGAALPATEKPVAGPVSRPVEMERNEELIVSPFTPDNIQRSSGSGGLQSGTSVYLPPSGGSLRGSMRKSLARERELLQVYFKNNVLVIFRFKISWFGM